MQLKEFVNSRVETVQSDEILQRAAEKMKELDVGSLPVCEGGQLVGMITDRDITIRAVAKGSDPAAATVREVMTPEVLWCYENEKVEEAARIMQEYQVRRILVLNEAKELVGITSLGELATITLDRLLVGEMLESVSESSEYRAMQEDELGDGNLTVTRIPKKAANYHVGRE
jgi:CBS domain-containing protein